MKTFGAFVATLALFLATFDVLKAEDEDYCDPELCRHGQHIACNNDWEMSDSCPRDAKVVKLTPKLKKLIVDEHNKVRNYVASGAHAKLDGACHMATIKWNNELAKLAELNVRQCRLKHDECHNTQQFKYSGQNVAEITYSGPTYIDYRLKKLLYMWYAEVENADRAIIKKYKSVENRKEDYSHFTVLANEKNTDVGCAISTYSSRHGRVTTLLLTCNYATTNILNLPVYKACETPARHCKTGRHPKYPFLCTLNEEFEQLE